MVSDLHECVACAKRIHEQRYPQAKALFLAGSFVRGEQTETSDLDLVVVFDRVSTAFRESYRFETFPVEAFVHDPQTLHYFFNQFERDAAVPSLAMMVSEGIEIPASTAPSRRLKSMADSFLEQGPPRWETSAINRSRYAITDAIDDLRDPVSPAELFATAGDLFPLLANHFFRKNDHWCAKGKNINRMLARHDAKMANRFEIAFADLFENCATSGVISLAADIIRTDGGWLFEGYRQDAPDQWRSTIDFSF